MSERNPDSGRAVLGRLAPDDPEPWTCDYCGLTLTPLNNEEMWHYVRTGESRHARTPACIPERVNHGKRRERPRRARG